MDDRMVGTWLGRWAALAARRVSGRVEAFALARVAVPVAALPAAAALALALAAPAGAADAQRLADVAHRGAQVMPFDLSATQHVFTKTDSGGVQQVVTRDPQDLVQARLIRAHLRQIQADFQRGDYAAPARIHGRDMPGLAVLRTAAPGALDIGYAELAGGAALAYYTHDPQLVAALHAWFDAQLDDHGGDAMAGHMHHHAAP